MEMLTDKYNADTGWARGGRRSGKSTCRKNGFFIDFFLLMLLFENIYAFENCSMEKRLFSISFQIRWKAESNKRISQQASLKTELCIRQTNSITGTKKTWRWQRDRASAANRVQPAFAPRNCCSFIALIRSEWSVLIEDDIWKEMGSSCL